MTPIINPLWFYWIDTLHALKYIFLVGGTGGLAWIVFCHLFAWIGDDDSGLKSKLYKRAFWLTILSFFIGIFIPNKTVMMQMLVAKYITVDNINLLLTSIKEAADYIIQQFK